MERNSYIDEEIRRIVLNSPKGYHNVLKKRTDLVDYIKKMTPELDSEKVNISTRIYWLLNDVHELPRCKSCGKIFHDRNANAVLGYIGLRYCSVKCQHADPEMQKLMIENISKAVNAPECREKFRRTCLEKFGSTSPLSSKEIQEKIKKTNLEKYGVDNPFKSSMIRNKIGQTNLEKYGAVNPFASDEIKEKIKDTWKEKYGVDNPNKSDEVRRKIEATELEKYGVKSHLSLERIKEQSLKTKKEKYGKNLEQIFKKAKQTSLEKYGFDNPEKANGWKSIESFKDYIIPLFTKEEYNKFSFKEGHAYRWKCTRCGNEFMSHLHKTMHVPEMPYLPRCIKCFPYLSGFSHKEKEVLEFIRSIYDGKIMENAKILLPSEVNGWKKNHELDIWLPDLKLGIEFNGNYFHDYEKFPEAKINDDFKQLACESQGIKLLTIWEHEWDSEKESVEDRILNEIEHRVEHNGTEINKK